jgi:beta-glucosidase
VITGAATSSLHSEGAAPASDWGGWEAAGWVPPSGDGNGFATTHVDDAALLAASGLGSLRLTLEWARLEPQQSDRGLDADEVDRYRHVLRAVRDAGLETWACLVHTTLPGWFSEDERGFLDDRMTTRVWPRHVDRVAEAFGDLVDGWVTVHEPVRHALDAWLHGTLPPGRHDGDDAALGLRHLLAADADAARLLHVPGGAPVATCRWLPTLRPLDNSAEARAATLAADDLLWRSWRDVDEPTSWLGMSCGYGISVGPDGSFHARRDGLGDTVERAAEAFPGRPLVVLTGAADDDDERRATTLTELDIELAELPVEQVHWWSAVDGYEGWRGFDVRSGLFDRDRNPSGIAALQRPR